MSHAFRLAGKKTNVIVYAGDGGTLDIGIQALSGAFERVLIFLYICYDNEAYGNTGMRGQEQLLWVQRPQQHQQGKTDAKKDIDAIIAAHNPPYQATAAAAFPQDLFKKVQKALSSVDLPSFTSSLPARRAGDSPRKKPWKWVSSR